MTLTDRTGAPVTVEKESDHFTIAVDGQQVGLAAFVDRGGQRVFHHTEVDEAFGGRGLGSIVIAEALAATRADGLRIVPVCSMVAAYVRKHDEFDDLVDKPTREIAQWLRER
ncbi:MAG: GNAT family N-acetyltransferase [Mycobacterium sp.]